jgi:cobalt-precorrin 5A hydrolase
VELGKTVIISGVGCRRGVSATAIAAAIDAAFEKSGHARSRLSAIATAASKGKEAGLAAAAKAFGVPLLLIPETELREASARALTRSERVERFLHTPSVAEAAALVAGGKRARLLGPRIAVGSVTCALAETEAQ